MPGSARNHERAQRLNASPFAKEIKGKIEEFFIKASKGPDDDMANIFKNNKVEAATMRCRPNALGPKRLSTRDSRQGRRQRQAPGRRRARGSMTGRRVRPPPAEFRDLTPQ
jgi:hypothetical protein